jgi:GNAT superfamily N-acetyltransferase
VAAAQVTFPGDRVEGCVLRVDRDGLVVDRGGRWATRRDDHDVWTLEHRESRLRIRRARPEDVPAIVALLADDVIGAERENPQSLAAYESAFTAIDADPNQLLIVMETPDSTGAPIATLQLTFIPCMSRRGATRAQVESVRVADAWRGAGLGRALLEWVITRSRERNCGLVQLTTDRRRTDALRFYESLGFLASHVGCKLDLD